MPAISATTHSVNTFDLEAQNKSEKLNQTSNKGRTNLKRTLFALCSLGLACGLIQAMRFHQPVVQHPRIRDLQANNATATPTATPQPEAEACPKGYSKYDKKRADKKSEKSLIVTGAMLASSPFVFCAANVAKTAWLAFPLLGSGVILGMGGFLGLVFSGINFASNKGKEDGKCYEIVQT